MPMLDDNKQKPARIMLYGVTKARKTMWAGTAAMAGFNVLVFDGDDGSHVLQQLPPDARKRVAVVNTQDIHHGSEFLNFMLNAFEGKEFAYHEQSKKTYRRINDKEKGSWFVHDGMFKMTTNDVLIVDSWSALTTSMFHRYAENVPGVDLANIDRFERDAYAWTQNSTRNLMATMHGLPCHIIVVAHEIIHEKYKGEGKNRELEFSRIQPAASSNNTSRLLGQHFSDIFRFRPDTVQQSTVDTGGRALVEGGSRIIAPGAFKFANYEMKPEERFFFGDYAKKAGYRVDPDYKPPYRFVNVE